MLERANTEQYPTIDLDRFGRKLKQVCEERGVSATDLQKYLHLNSVQAVYLWFAGKRIPNIDNLYAISRYLGVGIDDLVNSERQMQAYEILQNDTLPDHGKRVMLYWQRLPDEK